MENDRTASYDMRTYIGTKTVQAKRMNAADAKRAGANVPGKYYTMVAIALGHLREFSKMPIKWQIL